MESNEINALCILPNFVDDIIRELNVICLFKVN